MSKSITGRVISGKPKMILRVKNSSVQAMKAVELMGKAFGKVKVDMGNPFNADFSEIEKRVLASVPDKDADTYGRITKGKGKKV